MLVQTVVLMKAAQVSSLSHGELGGVTRLGEGELAQVIRLVEFSISA